MTSTERPAVSRRASQEPWTADGSTLAFVVRAVILVMVGGFLGGLVGLGVAGAGVVATWKRPTGLVAAASAAMLLAAAFATVFEVVPQPGSLRSNFADVRPLASAFGLSAGILAIVAVTTMALRERAPLPAVAAAPTGTDPGAAIGLAGLRARLSSPDSRARIRSAAPFVVVGFVTLVVRVALAPTALPADLHQLVGNLRSGAGYVLGTPGAYRANGSLPPVPALLGAFAPGGASLSLLLAGVSTVAFAMAVTNRLGGPRAALLAGVAVLVAEVATAQHLPSAAAGAFLLLATLLGLDQTSISARTIFAGISVGLAVLCEPWMLLALPLLALWIGFAPGRDRQGSWPAAGTAVAAAIVTLIPWQRYLIDQFGTWTISRDMSLSFGLVAAWIPLLLTLAASLLLSRRTDR